MGEWAGKVAVVTGGGSGIGLAIAQALARQGADVAIASRDAAKLEAAAAQIRPSGHRVLAVPCDVGDRAQVRALAARVETELGPVDLVCANAGATSVGRLLDHRDEDWDWAIDVNLRGATNCVQAFYPAMAKRRSGTLLITGSQTSLPPDWVGNHGPYVAAKAGVMALAASLRPEAAELGVKVSLLIPAGTETDIFSTWRHVPGQEESEIGPYPERPSPRMDLPFFLKPEEVAERALEGLRRDAPIIVTHAGMKPLVQDWCDRILAAYDEAERFGG
jgi:NAD(P)-dependent dehydrogenase (short-subunit alcohol dehydrogenase family)